MNERSTVNMIAHLVGAAFLLTLAIGCERSSKSEQAAAKAMSERAATKASWPIDLNNASLERNNSTIGQPSFPSAKRTPDGDVVLMLGQMMKVSKEEWLRKYSHVAGRDKRGWLQLNDGQRIQWLLRPGGLGYLRFQDGSEVYLASKRP